jgi:molybdopterin/thiamine biosynthesis adenylyltransferase
MSDLSRYHRQTLLPMIGEDGQRALATGRVLLVGCGALGSVIADALVRAGVGHLRLIDRDVVELTNLHRQVLFTEQDASEALPKAEAARQKLITINRAVEVDPVVGDLSPANVECLAADVAVIVDGTDNFETRLLINDAAVKLAIPYVYGGAVGVEGSWMTILPATESGNTPWEAADAVTPCLRCLVPQPPAPGSLPSCDTAGVLGSVAAIVAHQQVIAVLKILLGRFADFDGRMHSLNVWTGEQKAVDVCTARDPECSCCAKRQFTYLAGEKQSRSVTLCGRGAVQVTPGEPVDVDLDTLSARLAPHGEVKVNPYTLRATIEFQGAAHEVTVFPDGRAIIKGTSEPLVARNLYARYIGL